MRIIAIRLSPFPSQTALKKMKMKSIIALYEARGATERPPAFWTGAGQIEVHDVVCAESGSTEHSETRGRRVKRHRVTPSAFKRY